MKQVSLSVLLVSLFIWTPSGVAEEKKPIVAVFDIQTQRIKLKKLLRQALSDYLVNQVAGTGYFQVVPRAQLRLKLQGQKKKSYKLCFDQSCQIEVGRELAAQKTISAQLMRLAGKCTLNLSLYDLRKAATEGASSASGSCEEDGLVQSIEQAVAKLVEPKRKLEEGRKTAAKKQADEELARKNAEAARKAHEARKAKEDAGQKAQAAKAAKQQELQARAKIQVHQPGTSLYWLRCPLGQSWNGYACAGKAAFVTWHMARNACPAGYRLPTIDEYAKLLGGCRETHRGKGFKRCTSPCGKNPACAAMFAGKYDRSHWTATTRKDIPGLAWIAYLAGTLASADKKYASELTRCVRNGP